MKRQRVPLGELCDLVRGSSPISKTPPGQYPLVTTGKENKTAENFQFDAEAVCIPLISSTGHGHASLKRVHYQAGKFALANLLAVALIKDRSVLSAKFLARYLMFAKDRLIVPLMTGAANMSISIDRLKTIPVEFPPLAEQEQIVRLLDDADELLLLQAQADRRTDALLPAVFHEMFGEPTAANTRWQTSAIKGMGKVVTGNTPPRKNTKFYGSFIEWVKTDNIAPTSRIVGKATEMLSEQGAARGRVVPAGSVLVKCIAGSRDRIGDAAVTDREVAINQQINAIVPTAETDSAFLCELVRAIKPVIQSKLTGVMTGIINKSALEEIETIYPPFPLQRKFGMLASAIRELKVEQAASRRNMDALFQSLLHRAFEGDL